MSLVNTPAHRQRRFNDVYVLLLSKVNVFGPQQIFPRLVPGLGGLGYGLLCIPTMIAFYYTVIMAWAFYFMFQVNFHSLHRASIIIHIQGLRSELPWTSCITEHLIEFSTNHCFTKKDNDDCAASVGFSFGEKNLQNYFKKSGRWSDNILQQDVHRQRNILPRVQL